MFIANNKNEKIKPKIVSVSFRDTEDDIKMFNIICEHSSKGGFIKDILKHVLLKEKRQDTE